jgi:lysophospholipase L1-like esterase
MKGRTAVAIATLGLAAALVAIPAPAAARKHFRAYSSCGSAGKHADRFCFEGDHPVAVLRAFDKSRVAYRFCSRKAGERKHCRDRHTHKARQISRTRFDVDGSGKYKLAWFANGRSVGRAKLVIRERAVFSVGDSLGEGTKPYLPGALPGWKVSQSVSTSRFFDEGVSIVRNRGGLPAVIVFALGTNDDPHNVSGFRNAVSSVLQIAGKTRCVVVPNIVRPPVGGASYAGFNNALAELAAHRDNLRVADWAGLIARNRGWLAADGSHVNATGYNARAHLIAHQVERC